jgi:hypothetical protein
MPAKDHFLLVTIPLLVCVVVPFHAVGLVLHCGVGKQVHGLQGVVLIWIV